MKVAFVAGVADAKGFGWATAKQLANAGATVIVGKFEEVLASFGQDQLRIRDFLSPSSRYQVARYFQGANLSLSTQQNSFDRIPVGCFKEYQKCDELLVSDREAAQ